MILPIVQYRPLASKMIVVVYNRQNLINHHYLHSLLACKPLDVVVSELSQMRKRFYVSMYFEAIRPFLHCALPETGKLKA